MKEIFLRATLKVKISMSNEWVNDVILMYCTSFSNCPSLAVATSKSTLACVLSRDVLLSKSVCSTIVSNKDGKEGVLSSIKVNEQAEQCTKCSENYTAFDNCDRI